MWQQEIQSILSRVKHNDALDEYHRKLYGFYMERRKPMTDE